MQTHVAFLRGINLGKRRVTNSELISVIEDLGYTEVSAYQAAGNMLINAANVAQAETQLAAGLERALGYAVLTFVRSVAELSRIAAEAPFDSDAVGRGKLQITLLASVPPADAVQQVEKMSTTADLLRVIGREWYWWPQGGISESKLDFKTIERSLGIGTTRTAGTIQRIVRKLD